MCLLADQIRICLHDEVDYQKPSEGTKKYH